MENTNDTFWAWLAGLSDGEACFVVSKSTAGVIGVRMEISLREDDWGVLQYIRDTSGIGKLRSRKGSRKYETHRPCFGWVVQRIDDAVILRDAFLRQPLRSKKQRDFNLWAEAVALIDKYGGGAHSEAHSRLCEIHDEIKQVRKYVEPTIPAKSLGVPIRVGRSSAEFWESDEATPHKQWRQLRYAKLTQENIDDIVKRAAEGESHSTIAASHGVSVGLISKFTSGNYIRRDGSMQWAERVHRPSAATKEFWQTPEGKAKKRDVSIARAKLNQEQIDSLVERHAQGCSIHQLAREFGVSRPLVKKFISGQYVRRA